MKLIAQRVGLGEDLLASRRAGNELRYQFEEDRPMPLLRGGAVALHSQRHLQVAVRRGVGEVEAAFGRRRVLGVAQIRQQLFRTRQRILDLVNRPRLVDDRSCAERALQCA